MKNNEKSIIKDVFDLMRKAKNVIFIFCVLMILIIGACDILLNIDTNSGFLNVIQKILVVIAMFALFFPSKKEIKDSEKTNESKKRI